MAFFLHFPDVVIFFLNKSVMIDDIDIHHNYRRQYSGASYEEIN